MHPTIKQAADNGNLRSLKNFFANALDEDPTFENYQEEYDYIKAKGLLESHRDLTPFTEDPSGWTESYWLQLEADLQENFSEKRMEHMKRVAQVFLKEKIARLHAERSAEKQKAASVPPVVQKGTAAGPAQSTPFVKSEATTSSEQQRREIEAEQRRIAENNERMAAREQAQKRELERKRQELQQQSAQRGSPSSKKSRGIAAIAVAVLILLVIIAIAAMFAEK